MNGDWLKGYFDVAADATGAASALRRLILHLAVTGKLVSQRTDDEISPEVTRLVDSGLAETEPGLPANWTRAKVETIIELQYGKGLDQSKRSNVGPVTVYGSAGVVAFTHEPLSTKPVIIVGRKGSAGALSLCKGPTWVTDVAYYVESPPFFDIEYLLLSLRSLELGKLAKGVKPGLSRSDVYELFLAIPPLGEQRRISVKAAELEKLCDQLEAAVNEADTMRNRFTAAALSRLSLPSVDSAQFGADVQFALNSLDTLTVRSGQIKQLRRTIVELAVRGRLARQDSNDEPASILLERIAVQKARAVVGPRPRRNISDYDTDESSNFSLPSGWQWARMRDIVKLWNGFAFQSSDFQPSGVPVVRIGDLQGGKVILANAVCVDNSVAKDVESHIWIPPQALLIAMSGATTGKTAFNETGRTLLLNQRVGRIEAFLMNIEFVRLFFETIIDRNLRISSGTAIPNLSTEQIYETRVPIPPIQEQKRIVDRVRLLIGICNELETCLSREESIRAGLMEALIAGELHPKSFLQSQPVMA